MTRNIFKVILVFSFLLLSSCTFTNENKSDKDKIIFDEAVYLSDDYAIRFQVPMNFTYDAENKIFINDQSNMSISIYTICDIENQMTDKDTLIKEMSAHIKNDIQIYDHRIYNGYYHISGRTEDDKTYTLFTDRKIHTPFGNVQGGVAVVISSDETLNQKYIEQLFKYMQVYIKAQL